MDIFSNAILNHVPGRPRHGNAALGIITSTAFDDASAEIMSWEGYKPTPLVDLKDLADKIGVGAIHYKDEGPRFGLGSFKALGGAYAALQVLKRELGSAVNAADIQNGRAKQACAAITLVSATDGNHGRSLAWGCQRFGAPCRIYIHAEVSEGRAEVMRNLGADVIRIDGDYDASVAMARDEADKNGWFVVSDTSWPGYTQPPLDVMAGYGVMAREACSELQQPATHVFLQGGVGGMAAAMAASLRQLWGSDAPRVIVVEPDRAACLIESAAAGAATSVPVEQETIMAGLSCGEPSPLAWEILDEEASDFMTIPDDLVGPTMRLLARPTGKDPAVESGESAVAGLAALLAACAQPEVAAMLELNAESRILLFGSEGITDPEIYASIMAGNDHVHDA